MTLSLGSRLELFVDDHLIERMDNVVLKLHTPIPRDIAINSDEGQLAYVTVFKDDDRYRMYYREINMGKLNQLTSYAESSDGIHWVKPELGLIDYRGSKANNIVWDSGGLIPLHPGGIKATPAEIDWAFGVIRQREAQQYAARIDEQEKTNSDGSATSGPSATYSAEQERLITELAAFRRGGLPTTTHNFTPFKDTNPDCRPDERYKAVGGSGPKGLYAMASPDAFQWRFLSEEPIIHKGEHQGSRFDSQNVAFWDSVNGHYVAFTRDVRRNYRAIRRSTSPDFLHWSDPKWVDLGDTPDEHMYTNATTPYHRAPHILLAFPRRFVNFRKFPKDSPFVEAISDQVFMSSRDGGKSWDRHFMEAFIRPGPEKENWSDRNGTISLGVVPTSEKELSLYWVEHLRLPTCRLRRGTVRTDGFVSVNAPYAGGEFVTKPFTYDGGQLFLNYATSAAGSIRIDLLEAESSKPIGAFSADDMLMYGDEIDGLVTWRGGSDLSHFKGKTVRLRFVMKDADVYAFQFR